MNVTIRAAVLADAAALPPIEQSAGQSFRQVPDVAWLASEADAPIQTHQRYIALGTEWVAVNGNQDVIAFLAAEIMNRDLHICELAVRAGDQQKGIGRRLLEVAQMFAREHCLESLTLTTFEHVPWNAPWYSRLGFKTCWDDERLAALILAERARGWPRRCAMRIKLNGRRSTG